MSTLADRMDSAAARAMTEALETEARKWLVLWADSRRHYRTADHTDGDIFWHQQNACDAWAMTLLLVKIRRAGSLAARNQI